MKSIEIDSGGPVMPRSKSRATVRSLVSFGVLEVAHARRTDARLGQPVVEPGRRAVAEVGAHRLVDRREHLQQDEHHADEGERTGQAAAFLHDRDSHDGVAAGGGCLARPPSIEEAEDPLVVVFERNRVREGGREREERLLQGSGQPSVGAILVLRGESEAPGKQARSTEPERHGRPVGGLAISSRGGGCRAEKIVLDQTDRELDLAASAAEPVVDLCAPPVLGEHASDESRIGANRIDPDPAEHAERTQIALGLRELAESKTSPGWKRSSRRIVRPSLDVNHLRSLAIQPRSSGSKMSRRSSSTERTTVELVSARARFRRDSARGAEGRD